MENQSLAVEKAPVEDVEATYDVVVLGGAGLTASITAAQNGAKIILVEKAGSLGGNAMTDFLVFGRIAGENAVKAESFLLLKDACPTGMRLFFKSSKNCIKAARAHRALKLYGLRRTTDRKKNCQNVSNAL